MKYYECESGKLFHGNSEDILKDLPDNYVTAIVTDPPYGLSFMGKKWDYDVPSVEMFKEMLRVLKPGGIMLCFAGSRTQHRMAVNIEDAGFMLRDVIMWIYGSGFPKSYNIGKGVDKAQGSHREVMPNPLAKKQTQSKDTNCYHDYNANETISKGTSKWEGYGTAIKPAYEPIIIAMKPLDGTFVNNALEHGVSGINIDGCRIGTDDKLSFGSRELGDGNKYGKCIPTTEGIQNPSGRFPANIILDEEAGELLDEQSGVSKSVKRNGGTGGSGIYKGKFGNGSIGGFTDAGGASRFFYCAKASKAERNRGCEGLEEKAGGSLSGGADTGNGKIKTNQPICKNNHPTVKPLALMLYLTNLVKMPSDTLILDPFAGSGTTLVACVRNNIEFIGIEMEAEYCEIAKARIDAEQTQIRMRI